MGHQKCTHLILERLLVQHNPVIAGRASRAGRIGPALVRGTPVDVVHDLVSPPEVFEGGEGGAGELLQALLVLLRVPPRPDRLGHVLGDDIVEEALYLLGRDEVAKLKRGADHDGQERDGEVSKRLRI